VTKDSFATTSSNVSSENAKCSRYPNTRASFRTWVSKAASWRRPTNERRYQSPLMRKRRGAMAARKRLVAQPMSSRPCDQTESRPNQRPHDMAPLAPPAMRTTTIEYADGRSGVLMASSPVEGQEVRKGLPARRNLQGQSPRIIVSRDARITGDAKVGNTQHDRVAESQEEQYKASALPLRDLIVTEGKVDGANNSFRRCLFRCATRELIRPAAEVARDLVSTGEPGSHRLQTGENAQRSSNVVVSIFLTHHRRE